VCVCVWMDGWMDGWRREPYQGFGFVCDGKTVLLTLIRSRLEKLGTAEQEQLHLIPSDVFDKTSSPDVDFSTMTALVKELKTKLTTSVDGIAVAAPIEVIPVLAALMQDKGITAKFKRTAMHWAGVWGLQGHVDAINSFCDQIREPPAAPPAARARWFSAPWSAGWLSCASAEKE